MHFEVLVEDHSGKIALDILFPKIIGDKHTFVVHPYKGIGRIPKNMRDSRDASKRILMDNLPKLLKGYGRTQAGRKNFQEAVILVCDLDDKCLKIFRSELNRMANACHPKPDVRFCIAIEEGEAWFLGDLSAVRAAFPKSQDSVLDLYVNDSICGTWEALADAIYPGGSISLSGKGWQAIGEEKSKWALAITPHMRVGANVSPSFCYFLSKIQELIGVT
jgi:hypothetical protein